MNIKSSFKNGKSIVEERRTKSFLYVAMDPRLLRMFQGMGGPGGGGAAAPEQDVPKVDTAEKVHISSLALLKMLKHGRAGIPMEVMGLMLGQFVDDYTVNCVDVFAMPQNGTGVSVEAVDPVFQTDMLEMLKQTGRPEMVVGWYHSHPGFGCWMSGVDINTQQVKSANTFLCKCSFLDSSLWFVC